MQERQGCVAAVEVAVLADAAGGEAGVFECAAGFTAGEGFALGPFGAAVVGGGELPGQEYGFGAASGEAFALVAGEGVEEVLYEWVEDRRLVALAGGAGECLPAYGQGCGHRGQDAVAAVVEAGRSVGLCGAPTESRISGCDCLCCAHGAGFPPCNPPSCGGQPAKYAGCCGSWVGETCLRVAVRWPGCRVSVTRW